MITSENTPARDSVLAHLETLLSDRRFATAERNTRFLRYVVERTLDGKANEIKETVIATEVYGRTASYDPKADSIVRVEATRLRQKLRSYYENEGRDTPLRILLPSGTYVPQFEVHAPALAESLPAATPVPPPGRDPRPLAWAGIAAAAFFLVLIPVVNASRTSAAPIPEALAAWQEGVALLNHDPHTGQTERGAPPGLLRAIERLELAVARDPGMAQAWATLAEAYDYAFPYVGRDQAEDIRRAEAAARRAVLLDPRLAAGHHMLGLVQFMLKWDFAAAEQSYRRALALDPRNAYAVVEFADLLRETGRKQEAADLIRKSRALLPALPQLAAKEAEVQVDFGRYGAAIAAANAAVQMRRDYTRAHVIAGTAHEALGDVNEALAQYQRALTMDPMDRRALPAFGYLLGKAGQKERALEVARRLERMNSEVRNCAFQVAVVYAGLGDNQRTLDWLERAWKTRQVHFPFAVAEPRFRNLHRDPRFLALLGRIGLKPV